VIFVFSIPETILISFCLPVLVSAIGERWMGASAPAAVLCSPVAVAEDVESPLVAVELVDSVVAAAAALLAVPHLLS